LPRRFAPRNDVLKLVSRLRLQGAGAAIRIPAEKLGKLAAVGANSPEGPKNRHLAPNLHL